MPFVTDTFTGANGTNLQSHTSDSGHTWSELEATISGETEIQGNEIRVNPGSFVDRINVFSNSVTPPSANYKVNARVRAATTGSANRSCVIARLSNADNFYFAGIDGSADRFVIGKRSGGTLSILGSSADTWTANTNYDIVFELNGTSLKLFVGGVQKVSITDSSFSTTGKVGALFMTETGSSHEVYMDNFVGDLLTQTISAAGNIASAFASGTSKLHQRVLLTGIASPEVFGSHKLRQLITNITGIPTQEGIGTSTLLQNILSGFIESGEMWGNAALTFGNTLVAHGIISAEEFGLLLAHQSILAGDIESEEIVSEDADIRFIAQVLEALGIGSLEEFPLPKINMSAFPVSITSAENFPNPKVKQFIFSVSIESAEGVGFPILQFGDFNFIPLSLLRVIEPALLVEFDDEP